MEVNHTFTINTQAVVPPEASRGKKPNPKRNKSKGPPAQAGGVAPTAKNAHQKQHDKKSNGPSGQGKVRNQSGHHHAPSGKTGLGLGLGKKYDRNVCLFITGAVLLENESALKFVDKLITDSMLLDFRALEVIKLENSPPAFEILEPESSPDSPFLSLDSNTGRLTLVAVMSNPNHVQQVLEKAREFQKSAQNLMQYGGNIQFEGFLTKREQTLKAAVNHRVNLINKYFAGQKKTGILSGSTGQSDSSSASGAVENEAEAEIVSFNSYRHLGLVYTASFYKDSSIMWQAIQPIGNQNKGRGKGKNREVKSQITNDSTKNAEATESPTLENYVTTIASELSKLNTLFRAAN